MIVTKSWLSEWIDLNNISTDELAKTLNSIGLEVDRVHSYKVPQGIVFGRVLECYKHPDAEKLSICQVDVGSGVVLQIVCGASNVRADLDVVVATNGAIMPSGMVIKPVKLRGIESNGMICSAKEIGLEDIGSGIVELDSSIGKYALGDEVRTNAIFNDDLLEIELTANRGDCLSVRGVARDLSAAFDRNLLEIQNKESDEKRIGIGRILSLSHDSGVDVNLKYKAIELKDLSLPLLLRLRLAQIEVKFDSKIDSFMAYASHDSGVILRAYDYSFFNQTPNSLAKMSVVLDENGFVCINNKDNIRASIVGVIQDDSSKVVHNEGVVLIEASYVDPDDISKRMQNKKITSSQDYYKSSRGSEPLLDLGLRVTTRLLERYSSSIVFGGVIELSKELEDRIISIKRSEIDDIIGFRVDKLKITKILNNLGFDTTKSSGDNFVIIVPKHRHDIYNRQDVAEEIVRMIKIDNIPSKAFVFSEQNRLNSDYFSYKKRVEYRKKAAFNGFFESVHFVFDEKKSLQKFGFDTIQDSLELLNPIVNTLDTLRSTLLLSLLRSASNNAKNSYSSIRLFEIGSVFSANREESLKMGLVFSGDTQEASLLNSAKPPKVDFAYFTKILSSIIGDFDLVAQAPRHALAHPFVSASILKDSVVIGEVFRVHPFIELEYDLDVTIMCEIDFEKLPFEIKTAKESSKFQPSFRDLSLLVPNSITYDDIKNIIDKALSSDVKRYYVVDRYSDESLGESASLTIRFMLQSNDKTLEEDDISAVMSSILDALNQNLAIGLR